jgi:hypothetical protein
LAALICAALFRRQVAALLAALRKKAEPTLDKAKTALHSATQRFPGQLKALRAAAVAKGSAATPPLPPKAPHPPAASGESETVAARQTPRDAVHAAASAQAGTPAPRTEAAPNSNATQQMPKREAAAGAPGASKAAEIAAELTPDRHTVSSLAGVELIPSESAGSLVETVSMDGLLPATEDVAADALGEEDAISAFFLGKRPSVPPECGCITVGLRNRETLLGVYPGEGAPVPLFAPNPRGQVFSLSAAGNLYLHIDYFAPPSFVVHSVLSNVCLDHIFRMEDAQGNPLRPEDVRNRKILEILPARTRKTADGYYEVIEKGSLLIGAI